jgi:hypothetical protein
MVIVGAVLVVAMTGFLFAALALLRSSAPHMLRVHMTTDISRRNVSLAEQLRAEGARHHLDIVLTEKEYGTLEALEAVDAPNGIKLALFVGR